MIERTNNSGDLLGGGETRRALFSDCQRYRYLLEILWDGSKMPIQVIGLNPSTADEMRDDPTVAKLKRMSKRWGYGGLLMTNLFAYRATDPKNMKAQMEPIGHGNLDVLIETAKRASCVLAAWGNHGEWIGQNVSVTERFKVCNLMLHRLRLTKTNQPQHPLYLPEHLEPVFWK